MCICRTKNAPNEVWRGFIFCYKISLSTISACHCSSSKYTTNTKKRTKYLFCFICSLAVVFCCCYFVAAAICFVLLGLAKSFAFAIVIRFSFIHLHNALFFIQSIQMFVLRVFFTASYSFRDIHHVYFNFRTNNFNFRTEFVFAPIFFTIRSQTKHFEEKKQLFSLEVAMNEISIEFELFWFSESERFRSKKSQSVRLSHVKRQILRRPGLKAELISSFKSPLSQSFDFDNFSPASRTLHHSVYWNS